MKLNQLPNLRVEDFPTEQTWIGRLFTQLNPYIQAVSQLFDQNIDFFTNIKSISKDYTVTSFQEFSFQWPYKEVPNDLRITKATKTTQATPTILLPSWSYDSTQQSITVTNILEITSSGVFVLSGRYQFTIRANV